MKLEKLHLLDCIVMDIADVSEERVAVMCRDQQIQATCSVEAPPSLGWLPGP